MLEKFIISIKQKDVNDIITIPPTFIKKIKSKKHNLENYFKKLQENSFLMMGKSQILNLIISNIFFKIFNAVV